MNMKCKNCGKKLTAEGRLLSAIFGGDTQLCYDCSLLEQSPKCAICGKPTSLFLNNEPRCAGHMI